MILAHEAFRSDDETHRAVLAHYVAAFDTLRAEAARMRKRGGVHTRYADALDTMATQLDRMCARHLRACDVTAKAQETVTP